MKAQTHPLKGLAALAALFFAINLAAGALFNSARVDLTENELYTLSDGTRNILESLEEPITLRLFVSEEKLSEMPELRSYTQRVREMLEEYEDAADGMVELEVIDPEPFSEAEDRAVGFGLTGAPVNAAGELAYFGLAGTNSTDDEAVIRFFPMAREQLLEYDLTKLVHSLAHPERRVVGLLSTLPLGGGPANPLNPMERPQPWFVMAQMQQLFDVRNIEPRATEIPDDLDVLLVVHPRGFSEQLLYAIDQYALSGKPVIVLVDAYAESQFVPQDPNNLAQALVADRSSNLGGLLEAWGVSWDPETVVGDRTRAVRVQYRNQVMEYPLWLSLDGSNVAGDDPMVNELSRVTLGVATALRPVTGASSVFTPVLRTSTAAMQMERSMAQFGPDPRRMLVDYAEGGEELTVAARLSGLGRSAYADGPPPAVADAQEESGAETAPHRDSGELAVLVVGDADFLADRFWVQVQSFLGQTIGRPTADNGDLLVNALEILSGGSDLVSLRSRGRYNRPFDRVTEIRREAEDRFRAEEEQLEARLKETERKLNELQRERDASGDGALILTDEQREELDRFSKERIETRKRLREVRHQQAKDIEALGTRLKLANTVLVPALLVALAVGVSSSRRRKLGGKS